LEESTYRWLRKLCGYVLHDENQSMLREQLSKKSRVNKES
jgi:hypothetical protein